MNDRILLVDDDISLLNSLKRNLTFDFEVTACESGSEALACIKNSEPFSVVIVDMRMPGMEGIEVIQKARAISPNTVYMMLTGNQDLTTAMNAVNEGQVFRFLNKPCQMSDIRSAINAGLEQYDLITSKEELLRKTFAGAVSVLVEIIEFVDDPLVNTEVILETAEAMLADSNITSDWRVPLTARLMIAGIPLLNPDQRAILATESITSEKHRELVKEVFSISSQLIKQIPRLEPVSKLLDRVATIEISISKRDSLDDEIAQTLLICYYENLLQRRSENASLPAEEIEDRFPDINYDVSERLRLTANEPTATTIQNIPTADLSAGMTVANDVRLPDGVLLIAAGRKLSPPMIARLRNSVEPRSIAVEVAAKQTAELVAI